MELLYQRSRQCASAVGLALAAIWLSSLCLLPQLPARADDPSQAAVYSPNSGASNQQVDLDIVNANLLAVVSMLRAKSGAQIVVAGGEESYHPVTLTVSGSLSTVLHYVAVSAGATITRGADGVYVFRPASAASSDESAPADDGSQNADAPAPGNTPAPTRPLGPMHFERIVLQNVSPDFILTMLNDPSGLRDTSPYHRSDVKDTFSPIPGSPGYTPDITSGGAPINFMNSGNQGSSEQPSVPVSGSPIGADGSMAANRASSEQGTQAQQFITPGGGGFYPGGGFGAGAPGAFRPNAGFGGAPGVGGFPGAGGANSQNQNLRPEGIDSIIANEQDNSLLVRGDAQGIAELKQIISLLDIPPKQVQIKVEFVTATVSDVNSFNIQWDLIPFPSVEVGSPDSASVNNGGIFATYAHGNLVAKLFDFLSNGRAKNVSAPIIATTNNTPASIKETVQIPYVTTTTVAGATGGAIQGSTVNFLNVPTGIDVLPRVNGDNSVTLVLNPQLQVPGQSVIPNGPPPVTQEALQTIRTVANGETMVLGGLTTKNETNTTTKVPILGDLPIIGGLFRTRTQNVTDSELLIFVTPTVLPPLGSSTSSAGGSSSDTGVGVTP